MAAQNSGRGPTRGRGETPAREAAEAERQASSGDTERAPDPDEQRRSRTAEEDAQTDEEVE